MKINKKIILTEEEQDRDLTLETTDDAKNATVDEIADDLQKSVEIETNGQATMTDAGAEAYASDIKDVIDDIDAKVWVPFGKQHKLGVVKSELTDVLDDCLRTAKAQKRSKGISHAPNVLITGLPGSGKTSAVEAWAYSKGDDVNLLTVSVKDEDLPTSLHGINLRDVTKGDKVNAITKAYSNLFKVAEENDNCVLYLDEYNRGNQDIRSTLFDLFATRKLPGGRSLPGLLFVIATINPSSMYDETIIPLSDAEKSRFQIGGAGIIGKPESGVLQYDSTVPQAKQILGMDKQEAIRRFKEVGVPYLGDALDSIMELDIKDFMLNNKQFAFDSVDDDKENKDTLNQDAPAPFSQRDFFTMIEALDGIGDEEIDKVKKLDGDLTKIGVGAWTDKLARLISKAAISSKRRAMLQNILNDYISVSPSLINIWNNWCRKLGVEDTRIAKYFTDAFGGEGNTEQGPAQKLSDIELDAELFGDEKDDVDSVSPSDLGQLLGNFINDWN